MFFPKFQYFPLNWVEGMFLNAGHFQHSDNYFEEALRDARLTALCVGTYGLLPSSEFKIKLGAGAMPGMVRLVLEACRAILPAGHRVEILPDNVTRQSIPIEYPTTEFVPVPSLRYAIYLCADLNEKMPVGLPVERPVRNPYLMTKLYLEVVQMSQTLNGFAPNRLKIAEWENGKISANYIPPTLILAGNPKLLEKHQAFQLKMDGIVIAAMQVLEVFRAQDAAKVEFCQPLIQFIRSSWGHYRWQLPMQPPPAWVAYFGDFAGMVKSLIEIGDKDFVKNTLKDGNIHDLLRNVHYLLGLRTIVPEEMASVIVLMERFLESLSLTLQSLKTKLGTAPFHGDKANPRPNPNNIQVGG
ncbi:MAG: hypothetical protein RLZZ628_698 [Bacteroidota bacterium]|jgi:hypothetical protein